MDMHNPDRERGSPLGTILPICIVIAVLGYVISFYFETPTEASFLPYGFTIALFVYILTFADIRIGIAAMMLAIGLSPEISIAGISNLRLEDFIIPVVFFAWITRLIVQREELQPSALKWPIILYLAVAIFSAVLGFAYGSVRPKMAILVLGKTVEYFMIFVIILNNVRTHSELKAFVVLAILISILSCFAGFIRIPSYERLYGGPGLARVMGPFGETANILGGYLILHMGLIVGLFLNVEKFSHKVLLGIAFAILFYTLMLTYSRTSYIALGVGILLFGFLKQRKLLFVTAAGFILFPLIAPSAVISRASTIAQIGTERLPESFEARLYAWQRALDKTVESPLFGYGPSYTRLGDVDNEFVRVLQDMGIAGLLVFLWFLFVIGKQAFLVHNQVRQDKFLYGFIGGYIIAFFCIVVHAFGATSFTCIRTMETFMVLTGLMMIVVNRYGEWMRIYSSERVRVRRRSLRAGL
jgi:O-antigen ligase